MASGPNPLRLDGIPGLRIGMVTHYMPPHIGGIEIMADGLFWAYRKAGCEVIWIASRVPSETPECENGRIRVACWNVMERHLGVPWPIWTPASVGHLIRIINWADVLHIHDCLYLGCVLTMALARRVKKPVILSQHVGNIMYSSSILNMLARLAYKTLGKLVLREASHVVYCTPSAEYLVRKVLGLSLKESSCIPLGVDTTRFRPPRPEESYRSRMNFGLPNGKKVVLFVGRLLEKKGAQLFQEVARQSPGYHFLMVGKGPLRPLPQDNLTWIPFVPPEQMELVYQAADVLLLPSLSEGFPLVVMEAMSAGVPVIVNKDLTFSAKLESEGGCLVAELAPESFAKTLNRLMETPDLASDLGRRSRGLVERDLSVDLMSARYLSLLHQLVR